MKLKHVGMIVVSVLAMSSAAVSAAEGDESVTTTVNGGVIHFKGEVVRFGLHLTVLRMQKIILC
ncbi:pilus assembly protein [Escherichia coli]